MYNSKSEKGEPDPTAIGECSRFLEMRSDHPSGGDFEHTPLHQLEDLLKEKRGKVEDGHVVMWTRNKDFRCVVDGRE